MTLSGVIRVRQATVYTDSQALQYNLNRVKQLAQTRKSSAWSKPMLMDTESKTV